MRATIVASIVAAAIGLMALSSASALPVLGVGGISTPETSDLIQVRNGCGSAGTGTGTGIAACAMDPPGASAPPAGTGVRAGDVASATTTTEIGA
jgi:hypothetical protein